MSWMTEKSFSFDANEVAKHIIHTLDGMPPTREVRMVVREEVGRTFSQQTRNLLREHAEKTGKTIFFAGFDHEEN